MATIRQKKLAKAVVENSQSKEPMNKMQLVASVGYSDLVAEKKATEILTSKGVKEELEVLGFDEQTAKEVTSGIMIDETNEPKDRLKAAEMVFKVHGSFKESEKPSDNKGNTYNFLFSADVQKDVKEIEERIKAKLLNHVK